jgi:hypothetical protein
VLVLVRETMMLPLVAPHLPLFLLVAAFRYWLDFIFFLHIRYKKLKELHFCFFQKSLFRLSARLPFTKLQTV